MRKWGGDPAVEREYGVKSVTERTYQFENHTAQVLLEPAADASSAYGLLTYYESAPSSATPAGAPGRKMAPFGNMLLTVIGEGRGEQGALMARGPVFIRVSPLTNPPLAEADLRALLIEAGGPPPSPTVTESLPAPLPSQGLAPGSEKYLVGPETARRVLPQFPVALLGFDQGAEVQVGAYTAASARHGGAAVVTLVEISCPTVQLAIQRFTAIQKAQKAMALNEDHGAAWVYSRRAGTFVLLALGADSQSAAQRFLDQFTVAKQVSWDQRYPGDKNVVLQMVELVLANLMLVAILVSFSVVGGVLVFLSKSLARRRLSQSGLPGSGDGSIITLNLL